MSKVSIGLDGNLQQEDIIAGIDLGTTNSLIAVVNQDGIPVTLKGESGNAIVPSLIHFREDEIIVGEPARQYLLMAPENTIYSVKRLMGRSYKDVSGDSV